MINSSWFLQASDSNRYNDSIKNSLMIWCCSIWIEVKCQEYSISLGFQNHSSRKMQFMLVEMTLKQKFGNCLLVMLKKEILVGLRLLQIPHSAQEVQTSSSKELMIWNGRDRLFPQDLYSISCATFKDLNTWSLLITIPQTILSWEVSDIVVEIVTEKAKLAQAITAQNHKNQSFTTSQIESSS